MDKLLQLLTTSIIFLIVIYGADSRMVTSLDSIQLYANPEYLISNMTIRYLDKSHFKYFVDFDDDVLKEIPEFWVSLLYYQP